MRKFLYFILMIFLVSCGKSHNDVSRVEENINSNTGKVEEVLTGETEEGNNYQILEKNKRFDIAYEEIDSLYQGIEISEKRLNANPILKNGAKFISGLKNQYKSKLTEKIDGGINYSDYEKALSETDKNYIRDLELHLEIKDAKTGDNIKSGNIYLNNIKFGEFKDGVFNKDFKWPMGIEKYVVMVRSNGYGDVFININNLNNDGKLVYGELYLKKASEEKVSLAKDLKIGDIEEKNFLIEVPECALIDNNGKCFRGEAILKTNFVTGTEANSRYTTLNMMALTDDGKFEKLYSGGMAFTDFITSDGEILKVGEGKKVKITYKLTDKDIRAFSDLGTEKGKESENGYWFYDKDNQIWREGKASAQIDEKNKLFIAEVEKIY